MLLGQVSGHTDLKATVDLGDKNKRHPGVAASGSGQVLRLLTRDLASLLSGMAEAVGRRSAELASLLGGIADRS